jgi:hypothetical protein
MIIFGTNNKVIDGRTLVGTPCPTCSHTEYRTYGIQRYFHLYWIPTVPLSRRAGIECTHCQHALEGDAMPADMARQAWDGVFTGRSLVPMFTGLILIGLLVLYGVHAGTQADARRAALLEAPVVGDYYVVDYTTFYDEADEAFPYGVWRLTTVEDDSLHFQVSQTHYSIWTGATRAIRQGSAAADLAGDAEGIDVDHDQFAELRARGTFPTVIRE